MKHVGQETLHNVYLKRFKAYLSLGEEKRTQPVAAVIREEEAGSSGEKEAGSSGDMETCNSGEKEAGSSGEKVAGSSGDMETCNSGEKEAVGSGEKEAGSSCEKEAGSSREKETGNSGEKEAGSNDEKEIGSNSEKDAGSSGNEEKTVDSVEEADARLFLCEKGRCERLFTETVCLKVGHSQLTCTAVIWSIGYRSTLSCTVRVGLVPRNLILN
jgi:hypothetical protein